MWIGCFVDIGGIVDHHCLNFHSGRINPKTIKLVFVRNFATYTAGLTTKTSWFAIRIICPSGMRTVVSVS